MGLAAIWPPMLVAASLSFVYYVYMYHVELPQLEKAMGRVPVTGNPAANTGTMTLQAAVIEMAGFHVLLLLLVVSFLRAALTPPGSIPRDAEKWREGKFGISRADEDKIYQLINDDTFDAATLEAEAAFVKSLPVVERKLKNKGAKYRYCSTCDLYKPDRTHHCSVCNTCVLRMDHHCPWIANCVGFNNYKFFLLLLAYGAGCCAYVLVTMFPRFVKAFRPVVNTDTFLAQDLLVIIAYVFCVFLGLALFIFLCFHLSMVVGALTTIELREKRNSDSPQVQHRWAVANLKFNRGSGYRNLTHVLGSPWMWLFPVQSNQLYTDGTYSEVPCV